MYNRLKFYLELNEFLYNGQYGFRENMSTQHAIVDIVNSIQNNMWTTNCLLVVFSLTLKRLLIL